MIQIVKFREYDWRRPLMLLELVVAAGSMERAFQLMILANRIVVTSERTHRMLPRLVLASEPRP